MKDLAIGVDSHFKYLPIPGRVDNHLIVIEVVHEYCVIDCVKDVGIGDAVLSCTVFDLHSSNASST